jgi:YaiO family outer membrane protein
VKLNQFVVSVAIACACTTPALGQTGPFLEVSGDFSPVRIGGTYVNWQMAHLATGVQQEGRFGWMAMADRHQRGNVFDVSFGANGFRRIGAWTVFGSAAFVDNPHFLYERSLEGEVSRTLVGTLVAQVGYRHLEFPNSRVGIVQPGLSLYFARGMLEARTFLVRNVTANTDNVTVLARGAFDATSRVRLMTGFARGARIFDVSSLSNPNADAWVAFGSARFAVAPLWSVEVGIGGAHEDPFFSQRTASLRVRRSF